MTFLVSRPAGLIGFDAFMAWLQGAEGGFQCNPNDAGNWTGGDVGHGVLVGTNCGISAASYPGVNIAAMTWSSAAIIYRRDYWLAVQADTLPSPLAIATADAAVNNGVEAAIRFLQAAVGATVDGELGSETAGLVAALSKPGGLVAQANVRGATFRAIQARAEADLAAKDRDFEDGWMARLIALSFYVSS
jgi:lysozyme family protein